MAVLKGKQMPTPTRNVHLISVHVVNVKRIEEMGTFGIKSLKPSDKPLKMIKMSVLLCKVPLPATGLDFDYVGKFVAPTVHRHNKSWYPFPPSRCSLSSFLSEFVQGRERISKSKFAMEY